MSHGSKDPAAFTHTHTHTHTQPKGGVLEFHKNTDQQLNCPFALFVQILMCLFNQTTCIVCTFNIYCMRVYCI